MPRYYFDIHRPDNLSRDKIGSDCVGLDAIRETAVHVLPAVAASDLRRGKGRQTYSVLVRGEDNVTVYTATMTFADIWLGDTPIPEPEPEG